MKTARTFIAVGLQASPALKRVLERLHDMGKAVRAVDPGSLHLTLKFLGDTPLETIPDIARVVERCAAAEESFTAHLTGLGAFPHADRPSVIWAGMTGAEPVARLAEALEEEVAALGFPKEGRRFHPHVTLARIKFKPSPELRALLAEHQATEFGSLPVQRVSLYQSELGPEGPRYTVLASAPLG